MLAGTRGADELCQLRRIEKFKLHHYFSRTQAFTNSQFHYYLEEVMYKEVLSDKFELLE